MKSNNNGKSNKEKNPLINVLNRYKNEAKRLRATNFAITKLEEQYKIKSNIANDLISIPPTFNSLLHKTLNKI